MGAYWIAYLNAYVPIHCLFIAYWFAYVPMHCILCSLCFELFFLFRFSVCLFVSLSSKCQELVVYTQFFACVCSDMYGAFMRSMTRVLHQKRSVSQKFGGLNDRVFKVVLQYCVALFYI